MLTPDNILKVLGARGLLPSAYPNREYWGLRDDLDGLGIKLDWHADLSPFWDEAALGPVPSEQELALAATPLIALAVEPNGTGDGLVFTATLTDAPDGTATQWRLIDPLGAETLTNGTTSAGSDAWEIETNASGSYLVQVWADGFGFAELSAEGI
jgi:hypothetical protein